ncbi:MAG TPA: hypothetical protein VNU45_16875 [Rummeliibacillus sp.]|nr:hypothetical protein [Rummeliibacillus sp.]
MTNEMKVNVENEENKDKNEVVVSKNVAKSNERYDVVINEEGKYVRKAKYTDYCSVVAETPDEKIALFNLLEGGEENGNGLKDHVNKQIELKDVIFRTYDKVDENTGELEYGVLSYLIDADGTPFITSSKSVYFTLQNAFKIFGKPSDEAWVNMLLKIVKKKGLKHEFIDVKIVGLAKKK